MLYLAIAVAICLLLIRPAVQYRKLMLAYKRAHKLPDQTGDFFVGLKQKPNYSVLILGDSIAAGTGIRYFNDSMAGALAEKLSEYYHVHLCNRAAKGNWASDIAGEHLDGRWDLVLIVTGSNEVIHNTSPKAFRFYLNKIIAKTKPIAGKVILVGPGRVSAAELLPHWYRLMLRSQERKIEKTMKNVALKNDLIYINMLHMNLPSSVWASD